MLIIAKGRPIEIRCYAIAADGNQMTMQEGEDILFSLFCSGACVGADYITSEEDNHGEPYFRISVEKWYTLAKLTPGAYSIKLKIGERKMRLTEVFTIDRYKNNDNTGLPEGDRVVIRLTVKETVTGSITWAEDITVPGTLDSIRVNGGNYRMEDGVIRLPDYPQRLQDLTEDEGHQTLTKAERDKLAELSRMTPAEASDNNGLADKAYVKTQIEEATAHLRGINTYAIYESTFLRWANRLEHDTNDFVLWQKKDANGNIYLEKYVYNGESWQYEMRVFSTQFTAEQMATINSGLTRAELDSILNQHDDNSKNYDVEFTEYVDLITVDDVGNVIGGLWTQNGDVRKYRIQSAITVRKNGELLTMVSGNDAPGPGEYGLSVMCRGCRCLLSNSVIYVTSINNINDGLAATPQNFDYDAMRSMQSCQVDVVIDCEGKATLVKHFPIRIMHKDTPYVGADLSNSQSTVSWNTKTRAYVGLPLVIDVKMWHNNEFLSITSTDDVSVTAITGMTVTKALVTHEDGYKFCRVTISALPENLPLMQDIEITCAADYAGVSYERTLKHKLLRLTDVNVYSLIPSVTEVVLDSNRDQLSVSSIDCEVFCDSSDDKHYKVAYADFAAAGLVLCWRKFYTDGTSDADVTTYNGSAVTIATNVSKLVFYLWKRNANGTPDIQVLHDSEDIPVLRSGKDAPAPRENILLRTIFDNGLDFVKEAWSDATGRNPGIGSYDNISVDNSMMAEGHACIKIDASEILQSDSPPFKDIVQDVISRLKPGTWYTLSFYCNPGSKLYSYVWSGSSQASDRVVDDTAGIIMDGEELHASIPSDGLRIWEDGTTGTDMVRHTYTFKTVGAFATDSVKIIFRAIFGQTAYVCLPKLEEGKEATGYKPHESDLKGDKGDKGDTGPMYYPAGVYSASKTYTKTDDLCPVVECNGQYYYLKESSNVANNIHYGPEDSGGSTYWGIAAQFEMVITKALFTAFAALGSFIVSGDWFISQYGTLVGPGSNNKVTIDSTNVDTLFDISGSTITSVGGQKAYTYFDSADPAASGSVSSGTMKFAPKLAIDAKSGKMYAGDVVINGSGTFSGDLNAAGGTFSGNLNAAGGTFSGNLNAAGGIFRGGLRSPYKTDIPTSGSVRPLSLPNDSCVLITTDNVETYVVPAPSNDYNGLVVNIARLYGSYSQTITIRINGQVVKAHNGERLSTALESVDISLPRGKQLVLRCQMFTYAGSVVAQWMWENSLEFDTNLPKFLDSTNASAFQYWIDHKSTIETLIQREEQVW